MKMLTIGRNQAGGVPAAVAAGVVALTLLGGAHPVAAQGWSPETCAAVHAQRDWMASKPDIFGGKRGQDAIAEASNNLRTLCNDWSQATPPVGEAPALVPPSDAPDGPANPARSDAPSAAPPAAGPPPAADDGPDNRVETDRSACVLVTLTEVDAAMQQSVTANAADPFGAPGAQGCEFNSGGTASTSIIYFQANSAYYYDSFHTTAERNGVQAVAGLGDRAFSFVGNDGPGLVVAKGDKLFAVEFNGIGSGPDEKNRLLELAQQAVGRVR